MRHCIRAGLLLVALLLPVSGALAQSGGSGGGDGSQEPGGVTQEIKDLGREIKRAMKDQGEYVGKKLGELGEEGRSWVGDRTLQARVKTTLVGVLGVASVGRINVDVDEGVVTLEGELASWEEVARAVQAANQVEGARRVISRLSVPDSA